MQSAREMWVLTLLLQRGWHSILKKELLGAKGCRIHHCNCRHNPRSRISCICRSEHDGLSVGASLLPKRSMFTNPVSIPGMSHSASFQRDLEDEWSARPPNASPAAAALAWPEVNAQWTFAKSKILLPGLIGGRSKELDPWGGSTAHKLHESCLQKLRGGRPFLRLWPLRLPQHVYGRNYSVLLISWQPPWCNYFTDSS